MKRILLWFLLSLATFTVSSAAHAASPGDRWEISVLTISPGDPVFFRFGHDALLVHDKKRHQRWVFNWGTFSFEEPHLIEKFLRGRLTYWLSVQGYRGTLVHYRRENRWIVEQRLNLTRAQKLRLVRMVWRNARPENRKYRYDYYRDNCATRIRDVLDEVLDGRLHDASRGPAAMTFRGETSRLVADVWWGYLALNLAMGDYIDKPITDWDEMFVPMKLRDVLRNVKNVDEQGHVVPLVAEETMVVKADRRDPPPRPPNRKGVLLLLGLVMGGFFGGVSYWYFSWSRSDGKTPWGRRLALALPLLVWTTLTGFFGFMFVFFWTATDHQVAYGNENLLQMNPATMLLPVAAVGLLADRAWARRLTRLVLLLSVGLSALGLVLKVLPWFDQANGEMIAWLLPVWGGFAAGVLLAERRRAGGAAGDHDTEKPDDEPSTSTDGGDAEGAEQ